MSRSTRQKLISATLRPDRMKRPQGIEPLVELPAAPPNLTLPASEAFARLGRLAVEAGRLTSADLELLTLAARTLASCETLEGQLNAEGVVVHSRGATKTHPALNALTQNRALLLRLLDSLGLTPTARERLSAPPLAKAENPFAWLDKGATDELCNRLIG